MKNWNHWLKTRAKLYCSIRLWFSVLVGTFLSEPVFRPTNRIEVLISLILLRSRGLNHENEEEKEEAAEYNINPYPANVENMVIS